MRLTLITHIEAPVDRVFAAFIDLANAAQNVSAITKIEILTPGPIGEGTRFRETRLMFKKEATETMEITAFDPPNSYAIEAESCGSRWRTDFRFIAEGPQRTRVETAMTIKPVTFFARLMAPLSRLMMGTMRRCLEQDVEDLSRAAEAAPPGEVPVVTAGQAG